MSSSVLRTLLNDFKYLLGEQRCCLDLFDGIIIVQSFAVKKHEKARKVKSIVVQRSPIKTYITILLAITTTTPGSLGMLAFFVLMLGTG
jgi:hypothetical protein